MVLKPYMYIYICIQYILRKDYLLYPLLHYKVLLFDSKVIPYMVSSVYIPYGILKYKYMYYTWNVYIVYVFNGNVYNYVYS